MRITVCDSCGKRVEGHNLLGPDFTWLALDVEACDDKDHGQFCSWTCLAAWATEKAITREGVTPT